jgi:DNA modification methylase
MVEVFREVKRVLRDDGTLWLNIGDSYAAQRGGSHQPAETLAGGKHGKTDDGETVNRDRHAGYNPSRNASAIGLKHKDLVGIPWMLAFALRADGWYLRQDIIWHKPNPMPESVTDRCTKAHEYLFLLSKSERYYYDAESIKVAASQATLDRNKYGFNSAFKGQFAGSPVEERWQEGRKIENPDFCKDGRANRRSVWSVPTRPYRGAHFAAFPPALIEPCILAGCPKGGTVLDPFGGSGTTAEVALKNGRSVVLNELNPEYIKLAEARIAEATKQGVLL